MSTEVMDPNITKMLKDAAAKQTEEVGGNSGSFLSIRNKEFSLSNNTLGQEIDVVIMATAFVNAYYDKPYNQNKLSPPGCFATSIKELDLVPHANSPIPQGENCDTCHNNEWGSSATGSGKACKNGIRLVVLAYSSDGKVDEDNPAILTLPPTSIKPWNSYAKKIISAGVPTSAVITTLGFKKDMQYPVLTFSNKGFLEKELMKKLVTISSSDTNPYGAVGLEPFDVSGYEKAEPTPARSGMSKTV